MEKKDYKIISNRSIMRKRMFLTILSFLLAVMFVFAIFYLLFGRKSESWLDGTSGMARTSVYPFVFSSGNDIYTVDENLVVRDIDNNTRDAIYDNIFGKVYYIYKTTQEFFEYDIKDDSRTLLCSNVSSFKLFKERTVIPYVGTDGSLGLYSFNSKSTSLLRQPIDPDIYGKLPSSATNFVIGESSILYFDNFDISKQTADLKIRLSGGDVKKVDEGVLYTKIPVIFVGESGFSYYKESGLCFSTKKGKPYNVSGSASLVQTTYLGYADLMSNPPSDFLGTQNVKYYTVKKTDENGLIDIYEIKWNGSQIDSSLVCSNAYSVVNFDNVYSLLVYSVKQGDMLHIYTVTPGKNAKLIAETSPDSRLYFDAAGSLLYIMPGDDTVLTVDVFNLTKKTFEMDTKIGLISPVFGKPFSVIYSNDFATKTIVLKQSHTESYPSTEHRLYGKSDTVYLKLRDIEGRSVMSLDLVNGTTVKRITNSCDSSCIVYDKDLTNFIYYDKGTLYAVKNGTRTAIADFSDVVRPINVLTE